MHDLVAEEEQSKFVQPAAQQAQRPTNLDDFKVANWYKYVHGEQQPDEVHCTMSHFYHIIVSFDQYLCFDRFKWKFYKPNSAFLLKRVMAGCASSGLSVFVFGGIFENELCNDTLVFTREGVERIKGQYGKFPSPRALASLSYISYCNCLYVMGGIGGETRETFFGDCYAMSLSTNVWYKHQFVENLDGLCAHASTSYAEEVFIFGGSTGKEQYSNRIFVGQVCM